MDAAAPPTRAAQYLRMSTEHQRYSLHHQANVIAEYAKARGYVVVRTYSDAGKSGVQLRGRPALSQLLADVVGGDADFSTILVLDVSRWGRFQDLDEAAHYEFICRSSGVGVKYCAEPFENDGSIYSAIVKQLKRVMAAEYSRELGVKVAGVLRSLAAKGYRMSGSAGYGLRRLILDEKGYPGITLDAGERKAVQGHRIMLALGPAEEVAVVRRIYHLFVARKRTMVEIAKTLNGEGIANEFGRPWGAKSIKTVLTNEKYVGNNVFGYLTNRLGQKTRRNPPETWVRCDGAFPAIISKALFLKAGRRFTRHNLYLDNDGMLAALRALWHETGMLSLQVIEDCKTVPCANAYIRRFGRLSTAYALIGYDYKLALKQRHCDLSDDEMLARLAALLAARGKLTPRIIEGTPNLPSFGTYAARFGSLFAAYEAIGYFPSRTADPRPRLAQKYSKLAMIDGLRALHQREGLLSAKLIAADSAIPSYSHYRRQFGAIRQLYGQLGLPYQSQLMPTRIRAPDGRLIALKAMLSDPKTDPRPHAT